MTFRDDITDQIFLLSECTLNTTFLIVRIQGFPNWVTDILLSGKPFSGS